MKQYKYAGFISYSQRDKKWARKIHKALESYRLPSKLGDEKFTTRKLGKFFRDEDELSGAPSLDSALTGAIDSSQTLIVICSPNAVSSRWVDEEIRHFKRRGDSARVIPVIVSGKPDSPDPNEQCFPSTMFHRVEPDGSLGERIDEPWGPDARKEKFFRLITRLAAGIMQLDFDALWQREKRRRFRRRCIAVFATVALIIGGSSIALYGQRNLERSQSDALVSASRQALEDNRNHDALRLATLALQKGWASETPMSAIENYRIVSQNLPEVFRVYHRNLANVVERFPDEPHYPVGFALPVAGESILYTHGSNTGIQTGHARIWDIQTGAELGVINQNQYFSESFQTPDEKRLVIKDYASVRIWDLTADIELARVEHAFGQNPILFSDNKRLLTWTDNALRIMDIQTGREIFEAPCDFGIHNLSPVSYTHLTLPTIYSV